MDGDGDKFDELLRLMRVHIDETRGLRAEVGGLREEVRDLRGDVRSLEARVGKLERATRAGFRLLNGKLEKLNGRFDAFLTGPGHELRVRVDRLETDVSDLRRKVAALGPER